MTFKAVIAFSSYKQRQADSAFYLSEKRENTAVHDLLGEHFLFVQLPNELDVAEGTTAGLQ